MAGWPAAKSAEVPTECLSLAERGGLRGEHATLGEGDYRSFLRKRNGSIGRCRSAPYRAMLASSARSCGPNHERGGGSASVSQTMLTKSAQSIVHPTLPPEDGCRNRENCPCGAHQGRRSPQTASDSWSAPLPFDHGLKPGKNKVMHVYVTFAGSENGQRADVRVEHTPPVPA